MANHGNLSLYEFFKRFTDEEAARKFFEASVGDRRTTAPNCGQRLLSE